MIAANAPAISANQLVALARPCFTNEEIAEIEQAAWRQALFEVFNERASIRGKATSGSSGQRV